MAEIPIQEKRGSKSWLWILALVVLAALAWMLLSNNDDDAAGTVPAAETGAVTPADAPTPPLRIAA
jgi:hypothetical protein